ncbi:MAG TPA: UDP-N-acetylmuramate dehydrogenase [Terriglobales bacterium]|nr:UDP-N-acetylmuramate dehydrogenase [Terriglobales bacterium]
MKLLEQVPLAPLTTLQVGGPASYFVEARDLAEVREAVAFARDRGFPLFVLGGGSNLVVADRGFLGLVLKMAISGVEERDEGGKHVFEAGAGEDWDALVARAVARGCAGIECLSGIPGTVGGTPIQNVGAYGQEVSETITAVQVLDLEDGQVRELCNPACGFGYRSSLFNTTHRGRYLVLRVSFALTRGGPPRIEYADLKKFFAARARRPTLAETREAVRQIRHSKAMLIVPGDEDCRSAGSFFKNLLLDAAGFARLAGETARRGLQLPSFPGAEGRTKVPAAWLVEQAGFPRGYRRGPVGISGKHALAIVNRGGATAADILALKDAIQRRVAQEFGVELQTEPVFVGFGPQP